MSTNPPLKPHVQVGKNQSHPSTNTDVSTKLDLPLTSRSMTIRQDMTDTDGISISWSESMDVLRESLDKSQIGQVFRGKDSGEQFTSESKPRAFTDRWVKQNHARILDADRRLRREYSDCHTALLTLIGNPYRNGGFMSPLDYYQDLTESYSKENKDYRPIPEKLKYELSKKRDLEYAYVAITGVHDGGKSKQAGSVNMFYPHIHILVYVDGEVDESDFRSVIDKHVDHSPVASKDQHHYDKAIRVEQTADVDLYPISKLDRVRGEVTPAARDISSHLPKVGIENGQLAGSLANKLFYSMIFASNKKSWRTSNGYRESYESVYQERVDKDVDNQDCDDEDEEYEHIGYEIDGEVIESTGSSGSNNFLTFSQSIPDFYDPPPLKPHV